MAAPNNNEIFALYEAVTDEDHWRAVLGRICGQFGATGWGLVIGEGVGASVIASGISDAELGAVTRRSLEGALPEPDHGPGSQSNDVPHWRLPGAAAAAGVSGCGCVARLDHGEQVIGYAVLYRGPGMLAFDDCAIDAFLTLVPSLTKALALAIRVAEAEACSHRCAQCSDMLPFGCMLLDGAGSVLETNEVAAEILASGDGLMVVDNRLRALRERDDEALRRWRDQPSADDSAPGTSFISIPRPSGRTRYAVFKGRMSAPRSAFASRVPGLRLVIVDPACGSYVPRELVRALYELTERESWVAWHLANGDSLEEAARRLDITKNTARHYLERVFARTGAHRQSDLIRLLAAPFVSVGRTTRWDLASPTPLSGQIVPVGLPYNRDICGVVRRAGRRRPRASNCQRTPCTPRRSHGPSGLG